MNGVNPLTAAKMGDLGGNGSPDMVPVEAAYALHDAMVVTPGARHDMSATYGVEGG